jgi:2-polyprenyl-6-methoxyphenol hydroxylase-like FAD-dependent oxidoreductase
VNLASLADTWSSALPVAGRLLAQAGHFARLSIDGHTRIDCADHSDGRLVLLGSAAHTVPPHAGDNAEVAAVDAAVLVSELSAGRSLETSLDSYARRRRRAARRLERRAGRLNALSRLADPTLPVTGSAVLRLIDRMPAVATRIARTAEVEHPARLYDAVRCLRAHLPASHRRGIILP